MEIKVGDRFKTNGGCEVVVVEHVGATNITVEFMDSHKYRVVTSKAALLKGVVKNKFAPLLYGVGYIGVGEHKSGEVSTNLGFVNTKSYIAWINMLSRCYDPKYVNPERYARVSVDKDWYNFQVFATWHRAQISSSSSSNYNGKLCLDKDILSDDFVYSAATCCVVPYMINNLVISKYGGKLLPGVVPSAQNGYRVVPGYACSNIRFISETEAHLAYVEAKSNKIREVAVEYKEYLSPKVFNALMTRDFRYKFSPLFEPEKKATLH